ncbi:MAG: long-chain fatty acid--CoA ligase [Actinobacteria bacterium]|nr:MAG: long-chain fatty acid--CoA ligase [Actinomycetota bacterium]
MDRIWVKSYPPGVSDTIELPEEPVTALLDEAVRQFPNNIATDFEGQTLTYAQLGQAVDKFASVLRDLGVGKGTRVGTLLPNLPQNVITYYAALRLGGIMVENNPLYTERELEHQLNDAGVEVLVVMDQMYPKIKEIRNELPKLREVIVTNVFDAFKGIKAVLGPMTKKGKSVIAPVPRSEPVKFWKDVMRTAKGGVQQTPVNAKEDLALLQYTGGTTGVSKGVMLTHFNLVANCAQARAWFTDAEPGKEVVLIALPLFHSYGQTVCMNVGIMLAGKLVLEPNPRDLPAVLHTIGRTKPTIFPGVPTLYANLLAHPKLKETDMSSIRLCFSGAAPLPVEVQEQWEKVTGGRLVEGYGLSETSPIATGNPLYGKRKIGTIGLPVPETDIKLVDIDDPSKEVPAPGPGELCIKGPQVMQGYWNRPDETEEVLRDGWLYSGDIAEVDEDGFFKIVDRKKDMIIVGGFNVYPRDVEEILYQNPKVLEAAVIGKPNPRSGETVKAFIVLKPGEKMDNDEINKFMRENLTAYKVPKEYEFVADLPKTMVGKVLRRALVEQEKAKQAKS